MLNDIYFISDAHFGGHNTEREISKKKNFLSFANYIKGKAQYLFIVGDFFDFWFEYDTVIPQKYFDILRSLKEIVEAGTEIHYLSGNHDYWLGNFLSNQIGIFIHRSPLDITIQNKRLLIMHGDGLDPKDVGYRILKKILRNELCIFLFKLIHPDIANPIASKISDLGKYEKLTYEYFHTLPYINFAINKLKDGYDIVVLGHSHKPMILKYSNKFYLNPGNWFKDFSYGLLSKNNLTINLWKE